MPVPRKRCPKCSTTFEGVEVNDMYSCDVCGNGYLSPMEPLPEPDPDDEDSSSGNLPRSGGNTIFHTRDNF